MHHSFRLTTGLLGLALLAGCAGDPPAVEVTQTPATTGAPVAVLDTLIPAVIEVAGTANPVQQATLSTRVMATVEAVLVHEGDRVDSGALLARLDTRDLDARKAQVEAGLAEALAMERDAEAMARRIRALFADSAATRVQLEQAETGLVRAQAAVRTARAGAAELAAVASYAEIRAPFAGVVTRRFVDPGAMAAPGAPLVTVEDPSRLRIEVASTPTVFQSLSRGTPVEVVVEGRLVRGEVEAVVRGESGNMVRANVLVSNADGALVAGSAATVRVPQGMRNALVVPVGALVRQGDLVGVDLLVADRPERRWVRIGRSLPDGLVEVLSGLAAGDLVVVRDSLPGGS